MSARKTTVLFAVMVLLAVPAWADWNEGDSHKMHYPQLPDPFGWDVNVTYDTMFDDWMCSGTGPVSDIHFWGSWKGDMMSPISWIWVRIYSDVAAGDPLNPLPFSHPGAELWQRTFYPQDFRVAGPFFGDEGWYDPQPPDYPTIIPADHLQYWQINIEDIVEPFIQQRSETYWLGIHVGPMDSNTVFGWKTSLNHWNDDAVYWYTIVGQDPPYWHELRDPFTGESLDLAFVITPEPATAVLLLLGALGVVAVSRRVNK